MAMMAMGLGLVCDRRNLLVLYMRFVYYVGQLVHCCCRGEYFGGTMDGHALVFVKNTFGVITNEDPNFPTTIAQSSLGNGQKGVVLVKHPDVGLDTKQEEYR